MRHLLIIFTVLGLGMLKVSAQELDNVAQSVKQDLDKALTELAELRDTIASERIPLAQQADELERQVLAKRQERDRIQREADNQLVELNALKTEVKGLQDEHNYLSGLLNEYSRAFETRIHISEAKRYEAVVKEAQAASANADLSFREKTQRQLALVDASLSRLDELIGGKTFEGQALSPAGKLENGTFALVGPFAVFTSRDGGTAGLARLQLGSPEPTVVALGPETVEPIKALTSTGRGAFPLDPTMGNALKIAATEDTLIDHIKKGGPVMAPILGLGFAALLIALVKWIQLSKIKVAAPADLELILSHIRTGALEKAVAHAKQFKGTVGEMLTEAIRHSNEKKEYLEEIMYEKMLSAKPALEKFLPMIALTAATAPLLGLLGTVTGMINTFNMITVFGTGDPRMLSGGISEALITTKFGLIVAVPALICHAFISRKVKGVLGSMEQLTVGFINGIPEPEEQEQEERMSYV